ncbi:unnamed protein product [Lymnaea stagnalis]|uniref:Uncharacterized protein n=1 Tax=Lymnaea stagnalis TaxID=6523 RepID=A0AAV2HQD7_LYMST
MFRSRANDKDRTADAGVNREVSVPLVKTQDGKEFDPKAVQAQESKRRKRRIMKIAVYFMFGIIALGVFAIWLFHKDSVESLRFDSDFIITVKLRSLEVKNGEGDTVLYGEMGRFLEATPYDHCWDERYESFEDSCLYWKETAKLRVKRYNNGTSSSCYKVQWESLLTDKLAEDCFYLQRYHWYGYLTNVTPPWPISDVYIENMNYYTEYPEEQTENLVPVWFGQQGVAIFVDSSFPFVFSWNVSDKRQFCIRSKLSTQANNVPLTQLRYTICQSDSLKGVYSFTQQYRQDEDTDFAFKQKHKHLLLPKPIHALSARENLQDLLTQMARNESQCSLMELYDDWEKYYGALEIDPSISDQVQSMFLEASRLHCFPILPMSTFFSYKSQYFKEGVSKGYFVRDSQNLVTRMIKWRGNEGAALDVTNPSAEAWFLEHVRRLIKDMNVKALKLLHLSIPPDSKYYDYNMTHLDYTRKFYRDLGSLNISLVLELATGFIPLPVYTPVRMKFYGEPGSSCLNTSIPFSLMLGLSGFPLLIADADRMAVNSTTDDMFKRWVELAIFFPVLEIPSIPLLKNKTMQDFLHAALNLRDQLLLPYMTKLWRDEPDYPIIRPLWWVAPNDAHALTVNDQFMVGDDLLVAPILCEGTHERHVYLPKGTWESSANEIIPGPQTHNFNTRNKIPFYWKRDKTTDGQQDSYKK